MEAHVVGVYAMNPSLRRRQMGEDRDRLLDRLPIEPGRRERLSD